VHIAMPRGEITTIEINNTTYGFFFFYWFFFNKIYRNILSCSKQPIPSLKPWQPIVSLKGRQGVVSLKPFSAFFLSMRGSNVNASALL
jgi:hypothetical protein